MQHSFLPSCDASSHQVRTGDKTCSLCRPKDKKWTEPNFHIRPVIPWVKKCHTRTPKYLRFPLCSLWYSKMHRVCRVEEGVLQHLSRYNFRGPNSPPGAKPTQLAAMEQSIFEKRREEENNGVAKQKENVPWLVFFWKPSFLHTEASAKPRSISISFYGPVDPTLRYPSTLPGGTSLRHRCIDAAMTRR